MPKHTYGESHCKICAGFCLAARDIQKMRRWHYLKPNDMNETMHQCIFFDTETDELALEEEYSGHRLRFGWAAFTRRNTKGAWTKPVWKRFSTIEEFWLWAMHYTRKKVKTWIWCHNGAFDYPVVDAFCHLEDIGWSLESAILDAPPLLLKYCSNNKTLMLADTLNIWRMSLRELGQRIGLPKLEMPEKWSNSQDDDNYCKRDVEIILRSVTGWCDFLRSNDMGGFCPTIAAQAMRSFRHRWLHDRILIDANTQALVIARKSYHGGRCEAGHIGTFNGDFYYLDVNSMYPFVMSYAQMPLRLRGVSTSLAPFNLLELLKKYCLCAHVRLNTNLPTFGIVYNKKLCFPIGRFDAYLCTPEIEYALEHGFIEEVYCCCSYDKGVPFRDFAIDLYRHKEQASRDGNLVEAKHWKLILNSFYGKWGQNGRHLAEVGVCDRKLFKRERILNAQTGEKSIRVYFGGKVFERSKEAESTHSHPAIAAHICAHARMVLWTILEKIPPSEYFYCDTDGILVTAAGRDALADRLDQHALGGLKEVAHFTNLTIYGCKDLIVDGKQTLKGIKPNAHKIDEKTYRQIKWLGLRGLLAKGSLNMPLTVSVNKTLRRSYDKGTIGINGLVSPLHLDGFTG